MLDDLLKLERQDKQLTGVTFQINNAKLYVPVVTFSINDNVKLLENIKQGFEKTIYWNKDRSEITIQPKKHNSLDYLIDPTFNKLLVLLFRNCNGDPTKNLFSGNKKFIALIGNKQLFGQPVK